MKLDERHWRTEDGHRYTSVPVVGLEGLEDLDLWFRGVNGDGYITYSRGPYMIVRFPYGKSGFIRELWRDNERLACFRRVLDAYDRALRNARGEDVINVA